MATPTRTIQWGAFTILLLLLLTPFGWGSSSSLKTASATTRRKEQIRARHGAVAAEDGRCSKVGSDVLREGGHAVDAAVATALCLGVVSPACSGLGGGALMLLRTAHGKVQVFDMRETAPKKAHKDMYAGNEELKRHGGLSIAVPSELIGLYEAWRQYGRLPWSRLVEPAARFAYHGFTILPYFHSAMVRHESFILADKGLRSVFTSNGSLLQIGDTCYNKKLGATLLTISKDKLKSFYHGKIARNLVRDVQRIKGILSLQDLTDYRVKMRKPVYSKVFGLEIFGMPPPSSGGPAIALILNILAQYGSSLNSSIPLMTHRTIEALKHAFAVRMNLGDPDFDINVNKAANDMLSVKFAQDLQKTIYDNMTFNPSHYGGKWNQILDHGTTHVSIVDGDRNAVGLTTTINDHFGAKFLSPATGIILNNHMDDFSMPVDDTPANELHPPPSPANFIQPGKRPLSSTTPTIILQEGKLKAVIGGSGGFTIISGVLEVFLNYFVSGMDPLASVMAPRFNHRLIPNKVNFEDWVAVTGDHFSMPETTRTFLEARGHILNRFGIGSNIQFVVRDLVSNELVAVSDPRKNGYPAGY